MRRGLAGLAVHPYTLLAVTILAGSGNPVVARATVGDMPPMALSFWRWAIALAIVAPIGLRACILQRHMLLAQWRRVVAIAAIGIATFNSLIYLGVQTTTALNASFVLSAIPVMTVALSWLIHRERITWRMGFGVLAGLAGVTILISRGDPALLASLQLNRGDLLLLGAVVCWALYTILLGRLPQGLRPEGLLFAVVLLGTVMVAPFYAWEAAAGAHMDLSRGSLLGLFYLGAIASVFSYLMWTRGVAMVGANVASQFTYLNPVFGGVLAVVALGESVEVYHLGVLPIFLGIYLSTTGHGTRRGESGAR